MKSGQLLWRREEIDAVVEFIVLIPLKSGQLLWQAANAARTAYLGLNPFEIRATALARRVSESREFFGLNPFEIRATALARAEGLNAAWHKGLNPFEIRATALANYDPCRGSQQWS